MLAKEGWQGAMMRRCKLAFFAKVCASTVEPGSIHLGSRTIGNLQDRQAHILLPDSCHIMCADVRHGVLDLFQQLCT